MGVTRTAIVAGGGYAAKAIATRLNQDGLNVLRWFEHPTPVDFEAIARETAASVKSVDDLCLVVTSFARSRVGHFLNVSEAEWTERLDLEMSFPFLVIQAVAREFVVRQDPGVVVHVIERADQRSLSCAVTENGCRLMIAAAALDLIPSGVRVCGVSGANAPTLDVAYAEAIAGAVSFCASSRASYVVGSTFDLWQDREARWS